MFFAGVGMCADLSKLKQGGKALVIFLLVLLPFIIVQNAVGVGVAKLLDLHPIFGLVGGSITLVGGHGTGAAYAERFAEVNNLQTVMELSMTVATLGLIIGGIIAGPVAEYLIKRNNLRSQAVWEQRPIEPKRPFRSARSARSGRWQEFWPRWLRGGGWQLSFPAARSRSRRFCGACCSAWRSATWCPSACAWTIAHLT